ncbi:hypothetical protein OQA88_4613 [Cercophora sp. LCS_1]
MASDDLSARLASQDADLASCISAMRGEKVPWAIGSPVVEFCLIRGMRYHHGFASELKSASPTLTRAWNARRIMSNEVPDMTEPAHFPYCIWYPDVASEETYRNLAQRYPQMRYQIARGCAVAGYTDLYRELDILPEVHVAEEARDNNSLAIFNDIMSAPAKYAIMNDYDRAVDTKSLRVAFLNGDTAVRSSLDRKRKIEMPTRDDTWDEFRDCDWYEESTTQRFKPGLFNITEDGHIDTYDGYATPPPTKPDQISPLLCAPLPQDLPPGNKDILILMAAYHGNIDRYARLRRPAAIPNQIDCIMHGIYHNTLFAKWWAGRDITDSTDGLSRSYILAIRKAIHARFIMSNDISHITPSTPADEMPYMIWYPSVPSFYILRELVKKRPDMRQQIARACIVGGYDKLFDEIDPEVDAALLAEAKAAHSRHYEEVLNKKIEDAGEGFELKRFTFEDWKMLTRWDLKEPMLGDDVVWRDIDERLLQAQVCFPGFYEGYGLDTGALELSVCAGDMLEEGQERMHLGEFYGGAW